MLGTKHKLGKVFIHHSKTKTLPGYHVWRSRHKIKDSESDVDLCMTVKPKEKIKPDFSP